jgi:predicted ATP-grasp superfamily ATP-dependent carboligase
VVDVASFGSSPRPVSRSIRVFKRVPRPDLDPAGFVLQLSDFIRQGGQDMLIPTDDQALVAITTHYDALRNLAYIACPPPDIVSLVLDKMSTLELAQKCGIPIPKTKLISNSSQLSEGSFDYPFPWILKPAKKEIGVEEIKSYTLRSAAEVTKIFPRSREFTPPMLLQEYCAGTGVGVELLMHQGKRVATFQHRRLKELPYTGGYSVTAVAERPDPVLVEKSYALLRALQWEGPAMVEFKVDRDGSAVLMEVNGRYWGTISLPIFAGINFPVYHWQLLHNETPTVLGNYAVGTKWRWTAGHAWRLNGLLLAARHSSSARKEFLFSLLRFPAAFNPLICDALFTPSDPMPAIFELLRTFTYISSDDLRSLLRRFSLTE